VVATCEQSSRKDAPKVIPCKIIQVDQRKREVLLAHLAPATEMPANHNGPAFRFVVGSSWWEDHAAIVHPIDYEYCRDTRVCRLRTPLSEIRAALEDGRAEERRKKSRL
jgi:hypothetical protein